MVVANGPPKEVMDAPDSVTGAYLSGKRKIEVPQKRKKPTKNKIKIKGASHNNLQSINVDIPLGCMTAVSGVSGSGKSSLVSGILAPVLQRTLHKADTTPGKHTSITGLDDIDKSIIIDQSPIGRTPRSNPATYTKVFDEIRKLFSQTTLSKERGYTPGHFSFNVKGGRCEACSGAGSIKLEMNFLPDVWITCDICDGKRYTRECLEVTWKGKNIHDILEMPIGQAVKFFENHRKIHRILDTLRAVGLSYVRLGQPATTLSGGEAQRVKLASELRRPPTKHTVYILDEPTTGLALSDVQMLIDVLLELRAKGHTVIVIEHHLDVIKCCDWVIDLGPEGGDRGGSLVGKGTPEDIAANKNSFTGKYLAELL
jgi:excinuclease ABC subunit A